MSKILKNEKGFTLIEMLIVILIISILLLIAVPNMSKNTAVVKDKSCEATIELIQSQVAVYEVEKGTPPTDMSDLTDYVDTITCADGEALVLENGKVMRASEATTGS
ncbi:competence type IV pilus major pilin ComGC [Pseudalkalibacillus berkeleyi]|uniref:ComG operon protein 3 n=1 Tax=Pseudalkalibacillus berkeleyi TaxID=1069813 RepID=A0ABS9H234_9BACL|nr:competence type IV pilus major pilin ComGC [Pseudalkalibacillus berkeleyi]MCF6137887.1 prepilin-type N-terminal cleavage/methylation domain-containing protein [Pseudalkalibacillus berkeleyi]